MKDHWKFRLLPAGFAGPVSRRVLAIAMVSVAALVAAACTDEQIEDLTPGADETPTAVATTARTPSLTGTPARTGTPAVTGTPSTRATPGVTGTPSTRATPGVTGTPSTRATPGVTGTPAVRSTPGVVGTPAVQATPGVVGTPAVQATPMATVTPAVTGTPAVQATPGVTGTPAATGTPMATVTPSPTTEPDPYAGGILATFDVEGEEFVVWITHPDVIEQLEMMDSGQGNAMVPVSPLRLDAGQGDHNLPYGWHLDPALTMMVNADSAEIEDSCDVTPQTVQDGLQLFYEEVGKYCPSAAELVSIEDHRSPGDQQQ